MIGPDGNLWFTEMAPVPRISRLTPAGALKRFRLPNKARQPGAIIDGPDGALWFIAAPRGLRVRSAAIGRITTTGEISEFPVPGVRTISSLTAGPENSVWFISPKGVIANPRCDHGRGPPWPSHLHRLQLPVGRPEPRRRTRRAALGRRRKHGQRVGGRRDRDQSRPLCRSRRQHRRATFTGGRHRDLGALVA